MDKIKNSLKFDVITAFHHFYFILIEIVLWSLKNIQFIYKQYGYTLVVYNLKKNIWYNNIKCRKCVMIKNRSTNHITYIIIYMHCFIKIKICRK